MGEATLERKEPPSPIGEGGGFWGIKLPFEQRKVVRAILRESDEDVPGRAFLDLCALGIQQGDEWLFEIMLRHPDVKFVNYKLMQNFFIVGAEKDDQESILLDLLWENANDYDPWHSQKGCHFDSFYESCARKRMIFAVKTATRQKHRPLNNAVRTDHLDDDDNSDLLDYLSYHTGGCAYADAFSQELSYDLMAEILSGIKLQKPLTEIERKSLIYRALGYSYKEMKDFLETTRKKIDNALVHARDKIKRANST